MKKKMNIVLGTLLLISTIQSPLCAYAQSVSNITNSNIQDTVMEHTKANSFQLICVANTNSMKPTENKTMMDKDIVDIAIGDDRFKTLVAALKAAGLVDTLKGNGPFTVFAPTDEAFAKLPAGTIDNLLKPENKDTLVNILNYHVIPGKVLAEDAMKLNGKDATMANQEKARIEVREGSVYIDGAKVTMTDIVGKNGVIHVIDTVMMPPTNNMPAVETD